MTDENYTLLYGFQKSGEKVEFFRGENTRLWGYTINDGPKIYLPKMLSYLLDAYVLAPHFASNNEKEKFAALAEYLAQ